MAALVGAVIYHFIARKDRLFTATSYLVGYAQQYTKATFVTIQKNFFGFLFMNLLMGCLISIYNGYPGIFPALSKPAHAETYEWYEWQIIVNVSQLRHNICYAAIS